MTGHCEWHGPKRTEPLTRFDGTQIGNLTIDVCDQCDDEADGNFSRFISAVLDEEAGR